MGASANAKGVSFVVAGLLQNLFVYAAHGVRDSAFLSHDSRGDNTRIVSCSSNFTDDVRRIQAGLKSTHPTPCAAADTPTATTTTTAPTTPTTHNHNDGSNRNNNNNNPTTTTAATASTDDNGKTSDVALIT